MLALHVLPEKDYYPSGFESFAIILYEQTKKISY